MTNFAKFVGTHFDFLINGFGFALTSANDPVQAEIIFG